MLIAWNVSTITDFTAWSCDRISLSVLVVSDLYLPSVSLHIFFITNDVNYHSTTAQWYLHIPPGVKITKLYILSHRFVILYFVWLTINNDDFSKLRYLIYFVMETDCFVCKLGILSSFTQRKVKVKSSLYTHKCVLRSPGG